MDLGQRFAELRLGQDLKRALQDRTVSYEQGSKFDGAGWSYLDWKTCLLPQGGDAKNTKRPSRLARPYIIGMRLRTRVIWSEA